MRIGVVATGRRLSRDIVAPVTALAAEIDSGIELRFHEQCFASRGHFAGSDAERAAAFLEYANDPSLDAVWFGRGGAGTYRIVAAVMAGLGPAAHQKIWLGYSDAGFLLAALYRAGIGRPVHGPMPGDLVSKGPESVMRALRWFARRDEDALEPSLAGSLPAAAFNMVVLSHLLGTPLEPDLAGHVLMLEETCEPLYRIDRTMFHIASSASVRGVAGIRLGSCIPVEANDVDFGETEEAIVRHWCAVNAIPFLGSAAIGHTKDNRIVPFG